MAVIVGGVGAVARMLVLAHAEAPKHMEVFQNLKYPNGSVGLVYERIAAPFLGVITWFAVV